MSIKEKVKTKSYILIHSALFLLFIVVSFLAYAPVTQGHYFTAEDYSMIWTSDWEGINMQSYIWHLRNMVWEGRPLETLYRYLIFNKYINPVKTVAAANSVRFVGAISLGLLSYVLYLIFKVNRFKSSHAFLLSILICTLPPLQTYVSRVYTVVFIYGVLLSALSALILFKVVFREDRVKTVHMAIAVSTAIVLFIISLNIYQPASMTYWAMVVIPLIKINDRDYTKKKFLPFIIYFSAGFASMIIYWGIIKIIGSLLQNPLSYRSAFIHPGDIFNRIIWFIYYPLYGALNLWNIFPAKKVGLFVGFVIVAGISYGLGRVVLQILTEKKEDFYCGDI